MRIIIDGRFWSESGIGRYLRNLVHELQEIDENNEYYVLLLKKDYDAIDLKDKQSFSANNNFKKVLADFSWYGLDEQVKLPKLLEGLKPDLVHFPHFNIPIFYKGKYVVTIHDLIHQHFATRESTTKNFLIFAAKKYGYKKVFSSALKNSLQILTPSNFVKNQLTDEWGIKKDKIEVTYEGVDEDILKLSKTVGTYDFKKLAAKFNIRKPFLFYVGNAQPHKNIIKLIEAFTLLKKSYPDLSLVLSGPEHYFWKRIKEGLEGIDGLGELEKGDINFTGFVSEEELVTLYKNAAAFILPSLEEGFGIPMLEAMACSCPVISSNAGSLPEVGGDAALYFDPEDGQDMLLKLLMVLKDLGLRKELIKKGLTRYKNFSWKKMARQTLEVYKRCV